MKFDDVLLGVGEFGLYQKRLLLLISVTGGCVVIQNLSPVFTMKIPKHRSVCLYVGLFVCMPACQPVRLYACLSVCLGWSIRLNACVSVCPLLCVSVCLSAFLRETDTQI